MFSKFWLEIIKSDSLLIYELFIESRSTPAMLNGDRYQYINLLSYFSALVLHLMIKSSLSARVLASGSSIPMELRRDNKPELRRFEKLDSQYNEESLYIKHYMEHKMLFINVINQILKYF